VDYSLTQPRKRAPTILDVAKHAGVSVGTVSRYLNGISVRQSKRVSIEGAIAELRYSRNAAASAMRTDRSNLVALLVPGFGDFFGEILASLNTRLTDYGQVLLTHRHDRDHRAMSLALQFFRDHRVNAVIMPGVPRLRREIEALNDAGIPVIIFNNDLPDLRVDRVLTQNVQGSLSAMQYLVDMGHRYIGFLGGDMEESSATERLKGYTRAVSLHHLPVDQRYVLGDAWSRHVGYNSIRQLMELPQPPTAILAAGIDLALGVMDYANDVGLAIGDRLSLVSFDDAEIFRQWQPAITSIAQPTSKIGVEIAELVLLHIGGKHGNRYRDIRLECTIQLRNSVRRI
jgi:LacI family transcriptional regulator